ncbi:MAG: hypothetical protein PHC61_19260 [Chitinivibrionales bacterium]|nr:hypothetical protein [Chitinivibrionales bacterium]
MNLLLKLASGLSVLILLTACGSSYESKGDAAFNSAKSTSDANTKRLLEKTAYIMYHNAILAHPEKISPRLRERFIETTLIRANLVISEGTAGMDALPLYMTDIDKYLTPDAPENLKTMYANFLLTLADSTVAREKMDDALQLIDKALHLSANSAAATKRESLIGSFVKNKFDEASAIFAEAVKNKNDVRGLLSAEYLVQLVLKYKADYPGAADLLSKARVLNAGTYSAYKMVVDGKPDPVVDKYDIMMAVPTKSDKGGTVTLKVSMFNYSYNPLRMRAKNFFLVDDAGKKYQALESSKIDPEILDTEHETTALVLHFPKPSGKIASLLYENEEHKSQKFFY